MNQLTTQRNSFIQSEKVVFSYFVDFANDYISQLKNGRILTDKKVMYSEQSIRLYNAAMDHFMNFENLLERKVQTTEMNRTFLQAFERYLVSQGLTMNSVSVYLSKLKAICNVLIDNDVISGSFRTIKTRSEKTTQVYLSLDELKKLRSEKLSQSEKHIVDAFTINCFMGLRYDTLQKFLANPLAYIHETNGNTYLDIVSDKTGEQSVIPLGSAVMGIMKKYSGKLPTYSEQYFNRQIKVIARKAGICNEIVNRRTEGGTNNETIVPKWSKISSHTCRRTLISLMRVKGFNDTEITTLSGHSTTSAMLRYDRSGAYQKVQRMFGNDFFNTDI